MMTEFMNDEVSTVRGVSCGSRIEVVDTTPTILTIVDENENKVVGRCGSDVADLDCTG